MDPLSALCVASNILAVVDFAWTLLTETRAIYKSPAGTSGDAVFIETVVRNICLLDDTLVISDAVNGELDTLVKESKSLTAELLTALGHIKSRGRKSKWKSFAAALRDVWSKDKIKGLAGKLEILQGQIAKHIQHSIRREVIDTRRDVGELARLINELETVNSKLNLERKEDIRALENRLIRSLKPYVSINSHSTRDLQTTLLAQDDKPTQDDAIAGLKDAHELLVATKKINHVIRTTQSDQRFLQDLHFRSLPARFLNVEIAHPETFEWVFHDTPPPDSLRKQVRFREWLQTEHVIFWIHGKPGSGKSTLMKFLYKNRQTKEHLRQWAGNKKLIIAGFYFWHSGSALQKSQEGFLRSVIFEILRQCPDLIETAKEAVRDVAGILSSITTIDIWELDTLIDIYKAIVDSVLPVKFCLFVDGLDEFHEPKRTHQDLLATLRQLHHSPDIKLCVSSRPWTLFHDEFRQESDWQLKLEDLTHDDIKRYVTDKFQGHSQFPVLTTADPAYSQLVQSVVERAQGVFLWVYLAVKTILEGLTYHDSLTILKRRLEMFPPDLESFFQHLIDSVPPIYHKQTARYFAIAIKSEKPMLAMIYSFLDDLEEDPAFALNLKCGSMRSADVELRLDQMRRRLDGRSRGLLELENNYADSAFFDCKVNFLHRTVRDFLTDQHGSEQTIQVQLGNENPALITCKAILAAMKAAPFARTGVSAKHLLTIWLEDLFYFAHACLLTPGLDAEVQAILRAAETVYHATLNVFRLSADCALFVGLAAQIDFYSYMEAKLLQESVSNAVRSGAHEQVYGSPLEHALHLYTMRFHNHISLRCVERLLCAGADPNERVGESNSSTWSNFLCHLDPNSPALDRDVMYDLVRMLVNRGADRTARLTRVIPAWGAEPRTLNISAEAMIALLLGERTAEQLRDESSHGYAKSISNKSDAGDPTPSKKGPCCFM